MNTGASNPPAQPTFDSTQAPYSKLIRPEAIPTLTFLSAEIKVQYSNGVKNLWRSIQSKPASDPGHQEAVRKLQELTQSLMAQINQMKANMAKAQSSAIQQATQRIPQPQGQPQVSTPQPLNPVQAQIPPGQTRPAQQQIPNPAQQQTQQQQVQQAALHASVKQKVDAFVWTLPENIIDGTPEAEGWRTEARRRYTTWLYGQEMARITMAKLDSHMAQLRQAKKDVPETLLEQKSKAEATYQSNKNLIDGLMRNQNHARDQAARTAVAPNALAPSQPVSAGATQLGPGVANQVPRVQIASNPAIDATRQQGTPGASPAPGQISNGTSNFQLGQPQPPVMLAQQNQYASQVRPQPTPNQAYQQPQIPTPISGIGANGGPTPFFSHSAAVAAAARTYSSNQTPGQGMAGPLGHINGQSLSRTDSEKRQQNPLPINKSFVPQPPQPVSIGPARPTLPGSISGQVGMMGQPAIQKAPTYMLQGTGDRVLDKKKLDELVRQVTGGSGESLQPDVEESVLALADEFVDNVITSACKLAKLRGNNTLEIRDIQLILERHYNIRIPGYATDEVRTVRKIAPASGYLQKMNAVQAAKVMSGKTDV